MTLAHVSLTPLTYLPTTPHPCLYWHPCYAVYFLPLCPLPRGTNLTAHQLFSTKLSHDICFSGCFASPYSPPRPHAELKRKDQANYRGWIKDLEARLTDQWGLRKGSVQYSRWDDAFGYCKGATCLKKSPHCVLNPDTQDCGFSPGMMPDIPLCVQWWWGWFW